MLWQVLFQLAQNPQHYKLKLNVCWFVQSPIPLGSTVLLESSLDNKEGRKTFISCKVTSTDGSKLHTEATGNIIYSM